MLRKFGESPTDRYLTGDWWKPSQITSPILGDFELGDKAAAMMRLESCEYADNYLEVVSRF